MSVTSQNSSSSYLTNNEVSPIKHASLYYSQIDHPQYSTPVLSVKGLTKPVKPRVNFHSIDDLAHSIPRNGKIQSFMSK